MVMLTTQRLKKYCIAQPADRVIHNEDGRIVHFYPSTKDELLLHTSEGVGWI